MRLYLLQSLKLGTRSFVRNGSLVLLTIVAVIGIQIVFMAGLFGKAVFSYALEALEKRVDIRLSLVSDAPNESVDQLQKILTGIPHVKSVEKIESDKLYTSFQDRHAEDFLTLQALKELDANPFGDEIVIKLDSAEHYKGFFTQLQSSGAVSEELLSLIEDTDTLHNDEMVKRLANFQQTANNIGWVLIIASFLIIILVLSVVSRLFLSQYSADIKVMRSFGVSESHIGAWLCVTYSYCIVVATVFSMLCVAGIFQAFDAYIATLSAGLSLSTWFQTNLLGIVGFVFFVSLAIVHIVTLFFLGTHKK